MRRWWLCVCVMGAGCSFTPGVLLATDAPTADEPTDVATCASPAWALPYAHRFSLTTGGAPVGYTLRVDATPAFALAASSGDDLRVFAGGAELDRILAPPFVELKVPTTAVEIYVGNSLATSPPADPANVYLFAESFAGLPAGDHASARFEPLPEVDWSVVDDAGNAVYRAVGTTGPSQRRPAAIRGLTLADGDIRARMRINTGGGQQHNGLAARGNSMLQAGMDGFVGQLQGDTNRQRIAEYTDGATPPVELSAVNQTVTRDIWYALRLRYVGDNLELYVNNALVLTATKSGSDGQMVGLYAHDPIVDFDDITVRMAATPEPVAVLGVREDRCP